MTEIGKIDIELTRLFDSLDGKIQSIDLKEICRFQIQEASDKIPWHEINYSGIYLLEIKCDPSFNNFESWIENFKHRWEDDQYRKSFTPNIKKKRVNMHKELKEWIPIYIGKSKNIESRIHEHIYKEMHKTTFALKLNARENMKNDFFRLRTIRIEVQNYDAIVPRIESQLRNEINPIIGKQ